MKKYRLGTVEASEQLIRDLYINLRNEVNAWAQITLQTPQARMGYIGQHLVSVVTGYFGGKSGARGYDLIIDNNRYGEIKTCYRIDQLGKCTDCNHVVSSLENKCSGCGSYNIIRNDDSKWLISIRNEKEFSEILDPYRYYFVLFEFENINTPQNHNIVASIWEVDPKVKGFGYCMIDYYLNIRAKSKSKAPFNMWPHQLKFALTNPLLIYRAIITENGSINTKIFPTFNNSYIDKLAPLNEYSQSTTLTKSAVEEVLKKYCPSLNSGGKSKTELLHILEDIRIHKRINNLELCNDLAEAIYVPEIINKTEFIPSKILNYYNTKKLEPV